MPFSTALVTDSRALLAWEFILFLPINKNPYLNIYDLYKNSTKVLYTETITLASIRENKRVVNGH